MNADRILVFSEGHVVEEGTHKQLIEKEGIYADLVKFQLQKKFLLHYCVQKLFYLFHFYLHLIIYKILYE